MSKYRSSRAILVLEAPWELDEDDANRSSVLPFIEGVAKLTGDTEVHYANFYDKKSFNKALDCLCKGDFENRTVYIAAHGFKNKVAGVPLIDLLVQVGEKSKKHRITGVVLGSCFVGEHTVAMEVCLEESGLRWCAGYTPAANWLDATLIDCALIARMSAVEESVFYDRELIANELAESIRLFADDYIIGIDYEDNDVRLCDALRFVAQPCGRGHRARDITEMVWRFKNEEI
ncbi:hypothetical protein [Billgrantia aerodenitrificans]|uniref:Uncharacterized protein n=1 Tax=Billgrantia aerodenitrificans TaxID=2733483 RepID=A0ABS9AVL8_9GAMM|nr:hypothetical protein [Halomonas aerodenitrificans]MCE8025785.1 hypothetical protein [Halomonas aerodenitrificans]